MSYGDEYFCPNCGAILNDQPGFDSDSGTWTCQECGKFLMDDDIYSGDRFDGVAWYCDDCGALLNRQLGFSDSCDTWTCDECGHINRISEDAILNADEDCIECPNCGANLREQYDFEEYSYDHTCELCDAKLHRDYTSDDFEVVEEDDEEDSIRCPNCGANLREQYDFEEYSYDYTCESCDAKLHRDYTSDDFEVVEEDEEDDEEDSIRCPNCGANLRKQDGFVECSYDYTCESCDAELHRDYISLDFKVVKKEKADASHKQRRNNESYYKQEEKVNNGASRFNFYNYSANHKNAKNTKRKSVTKRFSHFIKNLFKVLLLLLFFPIALYMTIEFPFAFLVYIGISIWVIKSMKK